MRRVPLFVMLGLVVGLLATSPAGAATAGPELAQFDPETGQWHMRDAVGAVHSFYYGVPGDVPLLGDWDCDGDDTVGMYRPTNGFVYLRNSNDQGVADIEFYYGVSGDRPLAGDWNGDGCDTLAIFRSGRVFVRNELGTGVADYDFYFGVPGDRPFAGDFDGDGVSTIGLYRESDGFAYLRQENSTGIADSEFFYGVASDRIVVGDWDRDGDETVGIFRPAESRFYLSNENSTALADRQVRFGESYFRPVAGRLGLAAPPSEHAGALLWSDPATWGGQVPTAGQVVTIPAGKAVRLDASPPPLGGLRVDGTLVFDRQNIDLTTGWLLVTGYLQIGTAGEPFEQKATITLTGAEGTDTMGMGARVFGVMGGMVDLHGREDVTWTSLAATAAEGATSITLQQPVEWRPGERIVIASTDFDFEQAEERTITSVNGTTVRFAEPLAHLHWGELMWPGGRRVDERAEVAHLTRTIVIQGANDGFGGHMMAMPGSTTRIAHVELFHMGQAGELARYPMHWHLAGNGTGSYIRGAAIHHSFNRCVTIHGTNHILVEDNVGFDTFGHCYFLEDGAERFNVFDHNLGLVTRRPEGADALLGSDAGYPGPGTFWISNPDNTFTNNVAAGSRGVGFWIALPEHPTGQSATPAIWPRRTPLRRFDGNTSHSNGADGLHVDRGPLPNGDTETSYYDPRSVPGDPDSAPVTAHFTGFTAYKNRNGGAWLRGENHVVSGAVFADNATGLTFASDASELRDSLLVGETANLGDPESWEETGPNGRSLPQPWAANTTISGFDFYDGQVGVRDSHFVAFSNNHLRGSAALSVLDYTDFSLDTDNYASGLTFHPTSKHVYLETRATPTDPDSGEDGYRSAVFQDLDGSVTGLAGAAVTVNNPFLYDGSCAYRADWNARVCEKEFSALLVDDRSDTNTALGPIVVIRDDGISHTVIGRPDDGHNDHFRTSVLNGRSYTIDATGSWTPHFQVRTYEVADGEWLHVAVAGVGGTPAIYRDWWIDERNRLEPVGSLNALLGSDGGAYYKTGSTLHLKLVPQDGREWTALDICVSAGC
ncbi:MAG: transmembrane domain-containing protein [Acidimicrobiia bacterium]|nr:transmembrane domain-containing protein [Acidimicrobiia bacterium]